MKTACASVIKKYIFATVKSNRRDSKVRSQLLISVRRLTLCLFRKRSLCVSSSLKMRSGSFHLVSLSARLFQSPTTSKFLQLFGSFIEYVIRNWNLNALSLVH